MATSLVHHDRIQTLQDADLAEGRYVLYWMQRAQRAEHNDALEHAVRLANEHGVGLVVVFALQDGYPDAGRRHFRFMLQGLAETAGALERRDIRCTVRRGRPADVVGPLASDAVLVVTDRAYERHLVGWRQDVAGAVDCPVIEVESDVVVPVEVVSDKREYAARTIRSKLHRHLPHFAEELRTTSLDRHADRPEGDEIELCDIEAVLDELGLAPTAGPDRADDPHVFLEGGTAQAKAHLRRFLSDGLGGYGERSPDPVDPGVSYLSAYLHFGQISPVAVLLAVRGAGAADDDKAAFVEELIVRRELSANFVRFEPDYDRFSALPDWARQSLHEHRDDPRPAAYSARELEEGRTHDQAWNACMAEIRETGYLHNHLRMYWGKQVLLWTNTPEHAFRTTLDLNNRYLLDGRDCSSFANVAWVFGLHDRAFGERDVSGKTRPMTRGGLDRKLDVDGWLADVRQRLGDAAVDGPDGEAKEG